MKATATKRGRGRKQSVSKDMAVPQAADPKGGIIAVLIGLRGPAESPRDVKAPRDSASGT